jgi:hypothetical protein
MQFAGSGSAAASCIGPSARKKRGPQDDRKVGARAVCISQKGKSSNKKGAEWLPETKKNFRERQAMIIPAYPPSPGIVFLMSL